MKTLIILSSSTNSLINFRYDLLVYLRKQGLKIHAFGPEEDKEVINKLKNLDIQFHQYPLQRTGFSPLKDIKTICFLRKKFKTIKPDFILPYTVKPVVYSNIAKRGLGIKSVAWITGIGFYGLPSTSLKDKLSKYIMTILYKKGKEINDVFVFQNQEDVEFFKSKKILQENEKYKLTPGSGINLEKFYYSSAPTKPVKFVFVGRLIKAKGVQNFIEAAERVKVYNSDVEFLVLGAIDKDNPNTISEKKIQELHKKRAVYFTGRVSNVMDYVRNSSVFVLPSMYREGVPRSILEALSIGRAIITTDNVGCKETVVEEYNGMLIGKNNTKELVKAMQFFIANPDKIVEYGRNSRQYAQDKFNVDIVNEIIYDALV